MTAVLLTCAGKRYDIVAAFREHAFVVATDGNALAPAQYAANVRRSVPPVTDPQYISVLTELCQEFKIKAVVPLTDLDIETLASARDAFTAVGALLFAPDPEVARATHDKYLAHKLFLELDLPTPPTYLATELPNDLAFPMLVKPRAGSGGRNIYLANSPRELDFFVDYVPEPVMAQRFMHGDEFSVDILCDLDGNCLNAIPRTMVESRGGESIKGCTRRDPELVELGRRVGEALPCRGPATVQCFRDPEWGIGLTDVNCRFGGAFPAPMYAGGRYPELIVRMANGERIKPHIGTFQEGVSFSRYFWHLELTESESCDLEPTGRDFIEGGPPLPM